jgi:hypothetical protein
MFDASAVSGLRVEIESVKIGTHAVRSSRQGDKKFRDAPYGNGSEEVQRDVTK